MMTVSGRQWEVVRYRGRQLEREVDKRSGTAVAENGYAADKVFGIGGSIIFDIRSYHFYAGRNWDGK